MKLELYGGALCDSFHAPIRNFLTNNPGSYLEIGVYHAFFLAEIASQFPERIFYGVDPFIGDGHTKEPRGTFMEEVEQIATHNVGQVNNVTLFKEKTADFLKRKELNSILKTVSCVLIDGSHHYEDITYDIGLVLQINSEYEKAVFFDDVHVPDVQRSIQELKDKLQGRITRVGEDARYGEIYFK